MQSEREQTFRFGVIVLLFAALHLSSALPLQLMGGTDRYEFLASELVLTYGCVFSRLHFPRPIDRCPASRTRG